MTEAGSLHTRVSGLGDGHLPPVVLLHPLGVDGAFWQPVALHLPGRLLIAVEHPGHGDSPLPPPGTQTPAAVDVLVHDAVDRIGVTGAVDVVGVSLGGVVAQAVALAGRRLVRRLVLANTVPCYPELLRSGWLQRAEVVRVQGVTAELRRRTAQAWFTADADPVGVRYLDDMLSRTSAEGYARACELLAAADLRTAAAAIDVPTLGLYGEYEDPAFVDGARWFATHLPRARAAQIAGGAHGAALEVPGRFAEHLATFLSA